MAGVECPLPSVFSNTVSGERLDKEVLMWWGICVSVASWMSSDADVQRGSIVEGLEVSPRITILRLGETDSRIA